MLVHIVVLVTFISTLACATVQSPLLTGLFAQDASFHVFRDEDFPEHTIRFNEQNATLCDTNVTQYTGWLDIGHVHLFFWYN